MKNINRKIEKCTWKTLVEAKGTSMIEPNKKLIYCRDKCNGYDIRKDCYYTVPKGQGF